MALQDKPDFIVVGAAKSGTTSLFKYLNQRADVYIPEIKECRFFSQNKQNYTGEGAEFWINSGITSPEDYFTLFSTKRDLCCGDISPDYLYYYEESIKNINYYLGDTPKIIILLRNPIERAYSNYAHNVFEGWESLSFEQALLTEKNRTKKHFAWPYHYVQSGFYYSSVKAYLKSFNHVKIFLYEDFNNTSQMMSEISRFLNLPEIPLVHSEKFNQSGIPQNRQLSNFLNNDNIVKSILKPILPVKLRQTTKQYLKNKNLRKESIKLETRKMLHEVFKDDIEKLSVLINRDLSFWI